MSGKTKLLLGVAVVTLAWPGLAAADEATEARIRALEAQLAQMQAQLTELKAAAAAKPAPAMAAAASPAAPARSGPPPAVASIANGRPTFTSADGRFTASLRAIVQFDATRYDQASAGPLGSDFRRGSFGDATENDRARDLSDGTNFRRARLGIEGKAFGDFEYNFIYDFGGTGAEEAGKISAAWVQYNGLGPARLRIGAYPAPVDMDGDTSVAGSLFAERAAPAEMVRGIASGDGRAAATLFGGGDRWTAALSLTGNLVTVQTFDEQSALVGRLTFVPFKGEHSLVHLGVNGTRVLNPAATGPEVAGQAPTPIRLRERPEMRVDGTRLVDTGNLDADGLTSLGAEFGAQWKNLYVQSEYFDIEVDRKGAFADPNFSGWYAQAGWTLTGEPRRYAAGNGTFDAPRPAKPFDLAAGDWGAWELGLRYSKLDLNHAAGAPGTAPGASSVRGGEQEIWSLGLNWYVNAVLRFQLAYQDVSIDRLSPGGAAFGTATPPAGAQVGQELKIYTFRTQYAF
ncbi:MAG: OprO/OprP family phosphate-selective porin [Phenylobacterium sp.]|uniref:OprO/OprP family phosphate-selective porin n=1 Tax=Phenylobacterium sp. TaxID=1871053 RepID=UPI00391A4AE3